MITTKSRFIRFFPVWMALLLAPSLTLQAQSSEPLSLEPAAPVLISPTNEPEEPLNSSPTPGPDGRTPHSYLLGADDTLSVQVLEGQNPPFNR